MTAIKMGSTGFVGALDVIADANTIVFLASDLRSSLKHDKGPTINKSTSEKPGLFSRFETKPSQARIILLEKSGH